MSKIKKILMPVLVALLCVTLSLSAAFIIPKNNANAMTTTNTLNVGIDGTLTELSQYGIIDRVVLDDLYEKLTGVKGATLSDVSAKAMTSKSQSGHPYDGFNAYDIRKLTATKSDSSDGKDLIVKFGGLEWTVAYVSEDRNGDPVATLWLTNSSSLGLGTTKYVDWLLADSGNNRFNNVVSYPNQMYSTSLVRSKLNLGTKYSTSNSVANSTITQSATNKLAPFTMTQNQLDQAKAAAGASYNGAQYSLLKYIDMPYLLPYQQSLSELYCNNGTSTNSPNDAYGFPAETYTSYSYSAATTTPEKTNNARGYFIWSGNFDYSSYTLEGYITGTQVNLTGTTGFIQDNSNRSNANNSGTAASANMTTAELANINLKAGATWKKSYEWTDSELATARGWVDAESWAFDPVWLPSRSETSIESNNALTYTPKSVWQLSPNQRVNNETAWLRSGNNSFCQYAQRLYPEGGQPVGGLTNDVGGSVARGIRPALHLNLKTCEDWAVGLHQPKIKDASNSAGNLKNLTYTGDTIVYLEKPVPVGVTTSRSASAEVSTEWNFNVATYTLTAVDPGTYTITFTLGTNSLGKNYIWLEDGTYAPYSVRVVINKAIINLTEDENATKEYYYHEREDSSGNPGEQVTHSLLLNSSYPVSSSNAPGFNPNITYYYDPNPHKDGAHNNAVNNQPTGVTWVDEAAIIAAGNDTKATPGNYTLWYKITAHGHDDKIGYICVHIAKDTLNLTTIGSDTAVYGTFGSIAHDQASLYAMFQRYVNVRSSDLTGASGAAWIYGNNDIDASKFEFYFTYTHNGQTTELDTSSDAVWSIGTYSLNVRYNKSVPANEQYFNFNWINDNRPSLTISPRPVTLAVGVVGASDGVTGHVYGDRAPGFEWSLEFAAYDDDADTGFLPGDTPAKLGLGAISFIRKDGGAINSSTPAGKYTVIPDPSMLNSDGLYGNYKVTFKEVTDNYEVSKRPIEIYIKDFTRTYYDPFDKDEELQIDRSRVGGRGFVLTDSFDVLSKPEFELKNKDTGRTASPSRELDAGEYELSAIITADNYVITVGAGTYTVERAELKLNGITFKNLVVQWTGNPYRMAYSGTLPTAPADIPDGFAITPTYTYYNEDSTDPLSGPPSDKGRYDVVLTFTYSTKNYYPLDKEWEAKLVIAGEILNLPTISGTIYYNGQQQSPNIQNFVASKMTISGNTATNVGPYQVAIQLIDPDMVFSDGNVSVYIDWKIEPRPMTVYIVQYTLKKGGSIPSVSDLLYPQDGRLVGGDTVESVFGEYFDLTLTKDGKNYNLQSAYEPGEYIISAENGVYGNYDVTFVSNTYTIEEGYTFVPPGSSGDDNNDPNNPNNPGGTGGEASGGVGNGGGYYGSTFDTGEFLNKNLWWIILIAAIFLLLLLLAIILPLIRKRKDEEREKQLLELLVHNQSIPFQQPVQQPVIMQIPQQGENVPLQLASGIDEQALARAIAMALKESRTTETVVETQVVHDGVDDIDGFYDDAFGGDGSDDF